MVLCEQPYEPRKSGGRLYVDYKEFDAEWPKI